MSKQKPTLIIIPGLGDRVQWYKLLTFVWRRLGYNINIYSFGWEDTTKNFTDSFNQLLHFIDKQSSAVYIIGASAGGSVAINALNARPKMVQKIVTIASAFQYVSKFNNSKLKDSISQLKLVKIPLYNHTLSLYGLHDERVPARLTKSLNLQHRRIPIINHTLIIFTGLTIYSRYIHKFFK